MNNTLKTLTGQRVGLMGVTDTRFKLKLNDGNTTVLEAKEDEGDGYRSYLESVELSSEEGCTFFSQPIVWVIISADEDTWYFTGDNGHVWLEIGTDHSDDYYPHFVFRWTPQTA